MKYGVSCKLAVGLGVALLMASGCTGPETGPDEGVGTARVRIEAARTDNFEITQVTVTALGGFQADLARDSNGGFIGTLLLPAGFNELTGLAFAGDELVGVSAPVPVQIQSGLVTGATIRILDVTGGEDIPHSPVVLSLSHPLSALSNQPVLLSASAVDPDGQPLAVFWSTDCADAVLFSPSDFFTDFVKPTAGNCRVDVTVSDGALSATESFQIVFFDHGQASGGVNVDGEFVSAPQLFLDVNLPGPGSCNLFSESFDGTCQGSIASPERAPTSVFVDWGNAEPGFFSIFDNCGGTFEIQFSDPFFLQAEWRPPVVETVCLVTAQAFSNDGVFSQLSAAVRVRAGEPEPPPAQTIFASMSHSLGICEAFPGQTDVFCDAPIQAGDTVQFFGEVNWGARTPGEIFVSETCTGDILDISGDGFFFQGIWEVPQINGPCALVVNTESYEGVLAFTFLNISIVGAPPPGQIEAHVIIDHAEDQCVLDRGQTSKTCSPLLAGDTPIVHVDIDWGFAAPGQIQVNDSCGGGFSQLINDPFVWQAQWFPPFFPGGECLLQVNALAADGQGRTFEIFVPFQ